VVAPLYSIIGFIKIIEENTLHIINLQVLSNILLMIRKCQQIGINIAITYKKQGV
jgi:hypothetical protein